MIYYRVHKSLFLVCILSHATPFHTFVYTLVFQAVSSLQVFQAKYYIRFSPFPCVLHAKSHPIDIIVLSVHAVQWWYEGKFYEELECVMDQFLKYHLNILLRDSMQKTEGRNFQTNDQEWEFTRNQ